MMLSVGECTCCVGGCLRVTLHELKTLYEFSSNWAKNKVISAVIKTAYHSRLIDANEFTLP